MNLREALKLHRFEVMKKRGLLRSKPPVDYQRLNHFAYERHMSRVAKQNERLIAAVEKIANKQAEPDAVLAEREACAKQLDALGNDHCAAAIRARGQQAEPVVADDIELPPLPPSSAFSLTRSIYTADDMRDYARTAIARAEQQAEPVDADPTALRESQQRERLDSHLAGRKKGPSISTEFAVPHLAEDVEQAEPVDKALTNPEPVVDKEQAEPVSALTRYNEIAEDAETYTGNALERLRIFCSVAMTGEDWLDAEPFFDAGEAELTKLEQQAEPVQADPVFDAMLDALTTGTGIMSGFKRIYPFEMLDIGCSVCGIGAGKVMGYVCPRGDCPAKVTCGGNPSY